MASYTFYSMVAAIVKIGLKTNPQGVLDLKNGTFKPLIGEVKVIGECEICDTHLQEKRIHQDFWINGQLIVVENVPAGVCPKF